MPKVKYCVTEFTPTANQIGMSHSFSAKVVINSDIDGDTLAERVAKRSGFKDYECKAVMAAFAEIIQEEALESNRISLCNSRKPMRLPHRHEMRPDSPALCSEQLRFPNQTCKEPRFA